MQAHAEWRTRQPGTAARSCGWAGLGSFPARGLYSEPSPWSSLVTRSVALFPFLPPLPLPASPSPCNSERGLRAGPGKFTHGSNRLDCAATGMRAWARLSHKGLAHGLCFQASRHGNVNSEVHSFSLPKSGSLEITGQLPPSHHPQPLPGLQTTTCNNGPPSLVSWNRGSG